MMNLLFLILVITLIAFSFLDSKFHIVVGVNDSDHKAIIKHLLVDLCIVICFVFFVKYHTNLENIQREKEIALILEQFTSYEDVTACSTDQYDIYVHKTNESKEIVFHPKVKPSDTDYDRYYRIRPDLSYETVSKEQTSFGYNPYQD